jgi:hypothetical protein
MPGHDNRNGTATMAEAEVPARLPARSHCFMSNSLSFSWPNPQKRRAFTPELEQALIRYMEGAVEKRDRVADFILFCEGWRRLPRTK